MVASMDVPAKGGLSFDICRRNGLMEKKGFKAPGFLKTGATIVGLVFADGVVLGADTRATEGPIVAGKNYMVSSQLQLHHYATGREPRVVTALTLLKSHLFRYQGHVSAALVLGGVDCTGPHLHIVYPHGSTDTLPFATMGSGSLAAMSVFESKYKEGLTMEEGIQLVSEAICAGISNDLGSGSNVDVCVITKRTRITATSPLLPAEPEQLFTGVYILAGDTHATRVRQEYLRNHLLPNPRTYVSSKGYSFVLGQIEVLATKITPLKSLAEIMVGDTMEE